MSAKYGVYLHAAFEVFVGCNFIFTPEALHNGYTPSNGHERCSFDNFGIACIFWGLLLACKAGDRAVLAFDVMWNAVWVLVLGLTLAGKAWRPESAIEDGSFALVPVVAHSIFAVVALLAFNSASPKGKRV